MRKPLDDVGEEMEAVAKRLTNFTFPRIPPWEEIDTDCLKVRNLVIDGYDIIIHLSRADYQDCDVESLEICSPLSPFLPMYLVCKIGAKFLGSHNLKYAELFRNGRKIYVWTVALDERGRPIPLDETRTTQRNYEDFTFCCIDQEIN